MEPILRNIEDWKVYGDDLVIKISNGAWYNLSRIKYTRIRLTKQGEKKKVTSQTSVTKNQNLLISSSKKIFHLLLFSFPYFIIIKENHFIFWPQKTFVNSYILFFEAGSMVSYFEVI